MDSRAILCIDHSFFLGADYTRRVVELSIFDKVRLRVREKLHNMSRRRELFGWKFGIGLNTSAINPRSEPSR